MRFRARALIAAILVLCLVLVQHGAMLHGFAHAPSLETGPLHVDEQHALDDACEICLAYAAFGAAAPAASAHHPARGHADHPLAPLRSAIVAPSVAYAARAPPLLV